MPPKLEHVHRNIAANGEELIVPRLDADPIVLPTPLYWDSPTWHQWPPVVAKCLFEAMQSRGILVSALHSELGEYPDQEPVIDVAATDEGSLPTGEIAKTQTPQRILPYRNERYGLSALDFDSAAVVDVQLSPIREASGRMAYSAEQIGRWEATADDHPLAGGGWVPTMSLPPDVVSADHLGEKIQQLRVICPQAVVLVSVNPEWIDEVLPKIIDSRPDAILIRMGEMRMEGIALAQLIIRSCDKMRQAGAIPLWLTPPKAMHRGPLSVIDSVKMIALGCSATAINGWIGDLVEEIDEIPLPSSFDSDPQARMMTSVEEILQRLLDPRVEHFRGLYSSLRNSPTAVPAQPQEQTPPRELLGTFDPKIAAILGLPCVGQF